MQYTSKSGKPRPYIWSDITQEICEIEGFNREKKGHSFSCVFRFDTHWEQTGLWKHEF